MNRRLEEALEPLETWRSSGSPRFGSAAEHLDKQVAQMARRLEEAQATQLARAEANIENALKRQAAAGQEEWRSLESRLYSLANAQEEARERQFEDVLERGRAVHLAALERQFEGLAARLEGTLELQ